MSKQMRVSDAQYNIISSIAEKLGVSRSEVLSNSIVLAKLLVDNNAKAVKVVCSDGTERELLLTLFVGHAYEG